VKARKLVWTEGLFITQHHFQQLDRYHEALVHDRLGAALTYDWGLVDFELDERALSAGQLKIERLEAVLPDGTPVSVVEGLDDDIAPRTIEGAFPAHLRTLDVYVALAHDEPNRANVELEERANPLTRYVREEGAAIDVNTGVGEQAIAWARRNLRLLVGEERRESFEVLRVAQLVRTGTGAAALKTSFVPPVLRIDASPFLLAGFKRVLSAMTAKQRGLAEMRRQRTAAAVDFQASDAAKFWLLHTLNGQIPHFAHLVDQGKAHPEDAYLALASLIGDLCTFAVDGDPTAIPKFNYLELGDTFEPMFARALTLLDAVISERYVQIPLTRREDGMFLGRIEDPQVLRYEFYLAASGTAPEGTIRDRLPKLSKIASWNQIGAILNSAVNGVRLDLEYRPPGALPLKPGLTFFKVTRSPEYWNDIATSGSIAIYQPIALEPGALDLALYAVDPANLR